MKEVLQRKGRAKEMTSYIKEKGWGERRMLCAKGRMKNKEKHRTLNEETEGM